jgi:hypothetical protein
MQYPIHGKANIFQNQGAIPEKSASKPQKFLTKVRRDTIKVCFERMWQAVPCSIGPVGGIVKGQGVVCEFWISN